MKRSTMVLAAAVGLLLSGAARAADFALAFESCPAADIQGAPGSTGTLDIFATLTTTNDPGPDGPQGWSISVAVDGATVNSIAVKGVHVSTIFDDDGDPATPLVDPSDLDLNGAGFKVNQLASLPADPTIKGAVSAIVLHQTQKMVLHPSGTEKIAKLTLGYTVPAEGSTTAVNVRYLSGLKGLGQPVNNVVTFAGASVTPTLGNCTFNIKPVGAEFRLAFAEPGKSAPASGDTLIEQTVATGVETSVEVNVVLTTARLPGTEGPQGWSLSVKHEDCMTVDSVAVKGVHVSTIFDDDGDPATPLVDPSDLDLNNAGFKVNQKGAGCPTCVPPLDASINGAVSAIVLHQTQKMVLHANATDRLLKLVYKLPALPDGATAPVECHASFLDGLKGAGQPVFNVITYQGGSKKPTSLQGLTIRLKPQPPPPPKDNFVRGDPNGDGKEDLADAIFIVYHVVPSLSGPAYALPCADSGDANGDSMVDLGDAIFIINHQFRHGPPPAAPFPGCGTTDASKPESCPAGSTNCP